ncbi:M20/M25/M40 family metallo-hydrolase [Pontibacter qinzhouensis]|uniref:M20/M25/M40 family metallo-hydrolase n=1 Tax=Pontibacter qinzhouensis TaxID=2603253 RepID=A0A5C8JGJ2_9BACT|nr:M28 family metallopeptidase [Pontibacter qinzhouensis]TXK36522.1 M20/M25/M40 family metallo-hydrolase [Pontibacter qinzhouensis]
MNKSTFFFLVSALGFLVSCQSSDSTTETGNAEATSITAESYGNYVAALAADELEGRKPFTSGEKKTLDYLEQEFRALGLEPGNGDSFLQEVPMVEVTTTAAPTMTITGAKSMQLQGLQDYVIWTRRTEGAISLQKEEMVFAGFGIVAPEYNWNDYAGLDVKDKVVVVFVNDPGFYSQDSTFFRGKTMTYYGRWTYKFEEAARQGAKGCLIIHDATPAGYGFNVVQNNWNAAKLYLDPRGKNGYNCAMEGWVSKPVAEQLFAAAGMQYESALAAAGKAGFKPHAINLQLSTSMAVKTRFDKTYNVIAKIAGAARPDEAIIYSAHWDHLGIGKADEKGDSIYNGAVDNATGVASLLEIAKAFKSLPQKPERSVVFLSVTAEEQGLWGSAYYVENPVFAKEKTVANINVDMLIPSGKTNDIVLVGKGQSELEDILAEEAEKAGRYVANEATPEAGLYYRSDHFNFAKIGVPAMFTAAGIDNVAQGKEFGKKQQENYVANIYHKPSDEYSTDWALDGAVEDMKLLFNVGNRLASSTVWPGWKTGSEFKAVREAYKK